jgi:signal recognition particle subunit SRP54
MIPGFNANMIPKG